MTQPERDRAEDDTAPVGERELVVSGGESAPLLGVVEPALDDVAPLVVVVVVADGAAAAGTTTFPVTLLIGGLGDDRDDASGAQVMPYRARRVGLVAAHPVGSGARPTWASAPDAKMVHLDGEHRGVARLSRTDHNHQR